MYDTTPPLQGICRGGEGDQNVLGLVVPLLAANRLGDYGDDQCNNDTQHRHSP